jgi:hypothetical protein
VLEIVPYQGYGCHLIRSFNGERRERDKGMKGIKEKKEEIKDEHFLWAFPPVSYKRKCVESLEGTPKKNIKEYVLKRDICQSQY